MVRASAASTQTPGSASAAHNTSSSHVSALTAAASSALARDIPGVSKYTPSLPMRGARGVRGTQKGNKDDVPAYRARVEAAGSSGMGAGGEADAEVMRRLEVPEKIARLEQRWGSSWADSLLERCVLSLSESILFLTVLFEETYGQYEYPSTPDSRNDVKCAAISSSNQSKKPSR